MVFPQPLLVPAIKIRGSSFFIASPQKPQRPWGPPRLISQKKRGRATLPRITRRDTLAGNLLKMVRGETTYTAPKDRKGCGSSENCRSRLSAPKAAAAPYLQDRTHKPFQQVSWLTHPQLSANVFSETSNDRFSPHAGTSALTVAVPLGSCTRFPILFQGPTGPEALKPLFTFRFILPQPIGNVNKQPSRKTGLLRKNAAFMLSAPPNASEEAGTGPGPPRRGRLCCPYPPLAG